MKNSIILTVILMGSFMFTACNCKHCTDNLSAERDKIPYKDKALVEFKNDTLGLIQDTVFISLGEVSNKPYACSGGNDSDQELCSATSVLSYSNYFYVEIIQMSNFYGNEIIFTSNWTSKIHEKFDTIIFHNKKTPVIQKYYHTDTLGAEIWLHNINSDSTFVYNNFFYVKDPIIKLLQYSTVYKDGTRRVWRLQE